MMQNEMKACAKCGKPTVHLVKRPNHILHLLLTIFTLVWAVVWIIVTVTGGAALCSVCGTQS